MRLRDVLTLRDYKLFRLCCDLILMLEFCYVQKTQQRKEYSINMPLPPEKIKVVYCAPGERAKIIEIEDSPASFEAVVHGPICKLAYDPTRITKYHLICNDVTSFMNEKGNALIMV